jgi:predicted nucleic acid-binding protein
MSGFLLDTNVISELRKAKRADPRVVAWVESIATEDLFLSVLVLGEIRAGIERLRSNDPKQAAVLEKWLTVTQSDFADRILLINEAIADRWGRLEAITPFSTVDGLMAATALVHGLTVATRNIADFQRSGVPVVNPFVS